MTTTTDTDPRVSQILKWVLAGNSESDIIDAARQNWPDAEARPLILQAMQELAQAGDPDPAVMRGWCLMVLQDVHRRATESGDLATSLSAVKTLAKIAEVG
jgi:hypothetical protein